MSLDSGIRVEYTWQTRGDARVCPYCNRLHNHMWDADGENPLNQLNDQWGAWVWDIGSDVSRIHDSYHVLAPCRCYIDYNVQILWDGNYVDFGQYAHNLEEALRIKRELETAGGGAAAAGGYVPLWHMTQGADYLRGLGGGGAQSEMFQLYRVGMYPRMAARLARGQVTSYDILRISRDPLIRQGISMIPRYGASIAAGMGAAFPPILAAAVFWQLFGTFAVEQAEEHLRPYTEAQEFRTRETARERQRAWVSEYSKR